MIKAEGVLFAASKTAEGKWTWQRIHPTSPSKIDFCIPGFGEDSEHELYVFANNSSAVVGQTGKVYKLVAN